MVGEIEERCEAIAAKDIQVGHLLDLFADPYADPNSDPANGLEFELALVGGVKRGSVDCVTIYTDTVNFNCPPDWLLQVRGFMPGTVEF